MHEILVTGGAYTGMVLLAWLDGGSVVELAPSPDRPPQRPTWDHWSYTALCLLFYAGMVLTMLAIPGFSHPTFRLGHFGRVALLVFGSVVTAGCVTLGGLSYVACIVSTRRMDREIAALAARRAAGLGVGPGSLE